MTRCAPRDVPSTPARRRLALALALSGVVGLAWASPARVFPADALRGELTVLQPPEALLGKTPVRLAPGARIRDPQNLMVLSGALAGQRLDVRYTVDTSGLLMNVWILTAEERTQPWPRTRAEAAAWRFDPVAQRWSRP